MKVSLGVVATLASTVVASALSPTVSSIVRLPNERGFQAANVQRLTDDGNAYWPSWSPDGRRIAYFRVVRRGGIEDRRREACEVWTMGADGSGSQRLWEGSMRCGSGEEYALPLPPPSWSFDGRYLSVTNGSVAGTARIIDAFDGRDVTGTGAFEDIGALAVFAPRTPLLAYAFVQWREGKRSVHVRDIDNGNDFLIVAGDYGQPPEGYVHQLGWSASGQILRVPENRIDGVFLGRFAYSFYAVPTGELLLRSVDPMGEASGAYTMRDSTLSSSGSWQVISPLVEQIHSPQYGAMMFGRELVVAGATSRGFGEPVVRLNPPDRRTVLSYEWSPSGDVLLFTLGVDSRPVTDENGRRRILSKARASDIFVARFER